MDDDRLSTIEERLMALEGDVEAGEHERDELHRMRSRLEAAAASVQDLATQARREAEAAAHRVVDSLKKEMGAAHARAVKRGDLAEVRIAVERLERRLAAIEERAEQEPAPQEWLDELERAAIKLAKRLGRLRDEFDTLVRAIAQ